MPFDHGPARRVKAQAMLDALDKARRQHQPERTWPEVLAVLRGYSVAQWRELSVAAGRPDRAPSAETRAEVVASVAGLAEAPT